MAGVLGIDIGGTGIKAAPVDVEAGRMLADRVKLPTPQPAAPDPMAEVIRQLVGQFAWQGKIGIAFPGVVSGGTIRTAANLDQSWIGVNAVTFLGEAAGQPVTVLNDADAAGIAEMRFGAGRGKSGTVLLLTLGTGIGSALFYNGVLVPNTEFGHRVDEYLDKMEALLWPELIIIGGGISRKSDKFLPRLTLRGRVVPATLHNDAGIVGAAMAATLGGG